MIPFKNIPRLPYDARWMLHAHFVATSATCDRGPELLFDSQRHGVGAVIVKDNRPIAVGFNGSPPGVPHCDDVGHRMVDGHCVATLHAEDNAIIQCALDGCAIPEGSDLFVTAAPCIHCSHKILRAKIKRVIVGTPHGVKYGLTKEVEFYLTKHGVVDIKHINVLDYLPG